MKLHTRHLIIVLVLALILLIVAKVLAHPLPG